jgi:CheY-like chemotaxis protein
MLAHELRNPLSSIVASIDILGRAQKIEEKPAGQAFTVLSRQVAQMVRLVDDLLDTARISRGKLALRTERLDVTTVILDAVEAARPFCENYLHELTVTLPQNPLMVNADPDRLAQIVGNLLNNACKFTARGGHIWLSVDRAEASESERADESLGGAPHVAIRVRDTGIGIAAGQMEYVFNMFAQLDASLEKSATGLGIGLTLVKTLTEMHGGTVEARSSGIGQGSEFIVRLPLAAKISRPTSRTKAAAAAAVPSLRILVVDDDYDSAEMIATLLTFSNHETQMAHDGLAAVDAAANFQPDVIFMDIGLPTLDGFEAARRIRARQFGTRPLLVALTGSSQDTDRRRSQDAGFDAYLVKPIDDRLIGQLLAEYCSAREQSEANN